jgi:hypothetical protein
VSLQKSASETLHQALIPFLSFYISVLHENIILLSEWSICLAIIHMNEFHFRYSYLGKSWINLSSAYDLMSRHAFAVMHSGQ